MAETHKILGQSSPAATTNTTLYTSPASDSVHGRYWSNITSLLVCNSTASSITVRVFVVPSGGSAAQTNAIYYGTVIPANDTLTTEPGIILGPSDFVVVWASVTNIIFHLFGSEMIS